MRNRRKRAAGGKQKGKRLLLMAVIILLAAGMMAFKGGISRTADESLGWNLMLVNSRYRIPDDYSVELIRLSNGEQVDSRIYPDLQEMFDDARGAGYSLFVRAGYRSEEDQENLMEDKIEAYRQEGYSQREAEREAEKWVAKPGTSEHELNIPGNMDLFSDIRQRKKRLPESTMSLGISGMWGSRRRRRCMNRISAWKNMCSEFINN